MSAYSPSGSSNRKIANEMDEKIGVYSKLLDTVSDNERSNLRSKLLSARFMKEKLVAMTALARAQTILAEMDVLIAENNLETAFEQLDQFKKEHIQPEENKKSSVQKQEPKLQPKEPEKSSKESSRHSKHQRVASPVEADKENTKNATEKKKATPQIESHKEKSRSHTPTTSTTQKSNKRRHSSSSKSHRDKKAKKTHDEASTSESSKSSANTFITKAVQTGSQCFFDSEKSDKHIKHVSNRMLEDDERTVLIEELFVDEPRMHRDALNISKALQQILSPKTAVVPQDSADLMQSSVPSKLQLLFEDEPKRDAKKTHKIKVKTEVSETGPLDSSTDNLVNALFVDIMEAKSKHAASESNSSNPVSGTSAISKFMLRELLDKC